MKKNALDVLSISLLTMLFLCSCTGRTQQGTVIAPVTTSSVYDIYASDSESDTPDMQLIINPVRKDLNSAERTEVIKKILPQLETEPYFKNNGEGAITYLTNNGESDTFRYYSDFNRDELIWYKNILNMAALENGDFDSSWWIPLEYWYAGTRYYFDGKKWATVECDFSVLPYVSYMPFLDALREFLSDSKLIKECEAWRGEIIYGSKIEGYRYVFIREKTGQPNTVWQVEFCTEGEWNLTMINIVYEDESSVLIEYFGYERFDDVYENMINDLGHYFKSS